MNTSIIPQLIKKDLMIARKTIIVCCLLSLASIVIISLLHGRVPNWAFINLGITLLIVPPCTCGMMLLMRTIVMEKEKSTQLFIMSLPVTVKEFTVAKLLVNLPLFFALWLMITAAGFYFAFGLGIFPYGSIPFVTMIFLGIFIAYVGTLSVSLIYQSMGITILTMCGLELFTPAYLWIIAFLEPINSHVYDAHMVWNSAAISIVAVQVSVVALAFFVTWFVQKGKRDFI